MEFEEQTPYQSTCKVLLQKCDQHQRCSRPGGKGIRAGQLSGATNRISTPQQGLLEYLFY